MGPNQRIVAVVIREMVHRKTQREQEELAVALGISYVQLMNIWALHRAPSRSTAG